MFKISQSVTKFINYEMYPTKHLKQINLFNMTDNMALKKNINMSVCGTDLMRNFHVFACSAMSRLEITEQISRRL